MDISLRWTQRVLVPNVSWNLITIVCLTQVQVIENLESLGPCKGPPVRENCLYYTVWRL